MKSDNEFSHPIVIGKFTNYDCTIGQRFDPELKEESIGRLERVQNWSYK